MMNDDILRNIEYLREKADVSYEEAGDLLERFDGNVMRALVELERQGRIYPQGGPASDAQPHYTHQAHQQHKAEQGKKKNESIFRQALSHRLVIERGTGANKTVVVNLGVPFCAGAAIVAPWLAVGSAALALGMGYRMRVKKDQSGKVPETVEEFVDQTVSSVKKAATNFAETMRGDRQPSGRNDDNDDEGGEITIE